MGQLACSTAINIFRAVSALRRALWLSLGVFAEGFTESFLMHTFITEARMTSLKQG